MGYGARAERADARGAKNLTDADIYKIGIMGKAQRGIAGIADSIYSFKDFIKKCGSYVSSAYLAYIVAAFYQTLEAGVEVEMRILPYVASDAVQAAGTIMDTTATPDLVFNIKAGYKNKADKSAYGNNVAYKIAQSLNLTFKLSIDTLATPTYAILTSVEHLAVGYIVKIADGTNTEYAIITAIDATAKKITFAALTNTYTAALTTVSRVDWNLYIGLKDDNGVFQEVESWLDVPMAKSDTLGMPLLVNDDTTGSNYVIVTYDATNTSPAATITPAAVTSWTALASGADGTAATQSNYETLIEDFADTDNFILLAPELSSKDHNEAMIDFATSGYKCLYMGQSSLNADEATLTALGGALRSTFRFGFIPSDKWIEVDDPLSDGGKKQIPKVGHDAAHFFNNYQRNGEGKVPAGNSMPVNTTDRLLDSNGLVHDDSNGVGGRLIRNYGINICRYRKGKGITNNSARSLSSDDGYVFVNQIVGFLLYKRSIIEYLQSIEQDPAGVTAQEGHYNKIWAYLKKKYDSGVFFKGQKDDGSYTEMSDVVQIVNDFSINTLADIAAGKEQNFVQFVMAPPIEEPVLLLASAGVTRVRG